MNNQDPFGTQSITPDFNSLKTTGTLKLLVVIFVVDCSKTMSGDRIGAVNAALQELKYKLMEIKEDNSLDLRAAILSFASTPRWELPLTPIEEVDLKTIQVRPGLTEYGAAFHELNRVLTKEGYMKYTGKTAPPAIMFLTDGEPEDDYQEDLDELLHNTWFANASRSAVLLGDAISSESAQNAVRQFVKDEKQDIVTADASTYIIQRIQLATMHSVVGNQINENGSDYASTGGADTSSDGSPFGNSRSDGRDPFASGGSGGSDPFANDGSDGSDPFASSGSDDSDPFCGGMDANNPFDQPDMINGGGENC